MLGSPITTNALFLELRKVPRLVSCGCMYGVICAAAGVRAMDTKAWVMAFAGDSESQVQSNKLEGQDVIPGRGARMSNG